MTLSFYVFVITLMRTIGSSAKMVWLCRQENRVGLEWCTKRCRGVLQRFGATLLGHPTISYHSVGRNRGLTTNTVQIPSVFSPKHLVQRGTLELLERGRRAQLRYQCCQRAHEGSKGQCALWKEARENTALALYRMLHYLMP